MLAGSLSQTFRWAKVWAVCGAIAMLCVAVVQPGRIVLVDVAAGVELFAAMIVGAVIGASFGALAGIGYYLATALDSAAGARVPLGIIVGGVSGFLSMRIVRVHALSPQPAALGAIALGGLLGFFLASSGRPATNAKGH